jgi:uncharacterized phage protein gp47/JayE
MSVSTKTFSQMVQDGVAAIQGASSALVDMTVGSVLRAFVDAYSLLALWLQAIALQVASLTRFATSNGPDADSWGADYGFTRLGGAFAEGPVTFARFTPTAQALIAVGTIIQTQTGVQYQTLADTNQPAFNAALNAYVIPAGIASITATVQALVAGSAGNAGAGLISVLASSIPGVDTVTNALAFANGSPPEPDPVYKARFPQFLASLSSATPAAIKAAVQAIGTNVNFTYTENQNLDGSAHPGFFYVVADDGSGHPPSSFITAVAAAIEAVRGDSITYGVFPPTIILANVSMTIVTAAGFVHASVVAAVSAAITAYINTLPIGAALPYAILSSIAFGIPGVSNVPLGLYTLNGGTADIPATAQQIFKSGAIVIL